jgi:hypothetical protein
MNSMNLLLQRSRLALQEFGPSMALLTLPGGYVIALTDWIHRRWPQSASSADASHASSAPLSRPESTRPSAGAARE